MRRQFWAAFSCGVSSALLAIITVISREWIEFVFGVDPDGGNGALEWTIVLVTSAVAVVCLGWARLEWRRARFGEVTQRG